MKKSKLAVILSGVLLASMGGVMSISSHKTIQKQEVNNNILLVKPNEQTSDNACVINGDKKLVLTNKEGNIISYLSVGEMLKFQKVDGNKSLVKVVETGATGYISNSNRLIILNANPNDIEPLNYDGKIINVSSVVNLRENPSMDASIISKSTNSTKIKVIGKTGQWYKVNINGKTGFVFGEYVAKINNSSDNNNSNNNGLHNNNSNSNNSNNNNSNSNVNKPNDLNNNSSNGGNETKPVLNTGWKTVNGQKYFYYDNGKKATGYVRITKDGKVSENQNDITVPMYYFNKDGVMQTGWANGNYFNKDGAMQTGWLHIDNKYYFFWPDGQRQLGLVKHNGNTYWLNEDGTLYKGFKEYYGTLYFNKDGVMQTGWQTIDNNKYYFGEQGHMQTGWATLNNKTYYFNNKGIMLTGKQVIDGKTYEFAKDGELLGSHKYDLTKYLQQLADVKSGSMTGIINTEPAKILLQDNIKVISNNEIETKVVYTDTNKTGIAKIKDNNGQLVFFIYNNDNKLVDQFQTIRTEKVENGKTVVSYVYNDDISRMQVTL